MLGNNLVQDQTRNCGGGTQNQTIVVQYDNCDCVSWEDDGTPYCSGTDWVQPQRKYCDWPVPVTRNVVLQSNSCNCVDWSNFGDSYCDNNTLIQTQIRTCDGSTHYQTIPIGSCDRFWQLQECGSGTYYYTSVDLSSYPVDGVFTSSAGMFCDFSMSRLLKTGSSLYLPSGSYPSNYLSFVVYRDITTCYNPYTLANDTNISLTSHGAMGPNYFIEMSETNNVGNSNFNSLYYSLEILDTVTNSNCYGNGLYVYVDDSEAASFGVVLPSSIVSGNCKKLVLRSYALDIYGKETCTTENIYYL